MKMQTVDRPNTTPIGQDRETLRSKLCSILMELFLRKSVDCFAGVYMALFGLVHDTNG